MRTLPRIWVIIFTFVGLTFGACTAQSAVENPLAENQIQAAATPEVNLTVEPTSVPIREKTQPSSDPTDTSIESDVTAVLTPTPTVSSEPTIEQSGTNANADVLFVKARQESEDTWHFSVTVEHPDTGWEDYADGWDVVLPDGSVVKPDPDSPFTRLLLHPHETEQPFTRSQGGINIMPGITSVTVRAHDLVDGFGGREIIVDLMSDGGVDYEVQRLLD